MLSERAKAAGLSTHTLAQLLGITHSTAWRQLAGERRDGAARAIITAWEIMTPEQRQAWIAASRIEA